ncbi:MAG: hypothetical protein ACKON9_14765, partial [Planctomycetaceae bacterium]
APLYQLRTRFQIQSCKIPPQPHTSGNSAARMPEKFFSPIPPKKRKKNRKTTHIEIATRLTGK